MYKSEHQVFGTGENKDGLDIETKKEDLSVQRAKYVYDYLARLGIDASRITYKGFGAKPEDLSTGGEPGANDEEPKGRDQDITVVVMKGQIVYQNSAVKRRV